MKASGGQFPCAPQGGRIFLDDLISPELEMFSYGSDPNCLIEGHKISGDKPGNISRLNKVQFSGKRFGIDEIYVRCLVKHGQQFFRNLNCGEQYT